MILDGGPCTGGIESTVVDVTNGAVRLLRPGLVSVPMLEEVIGKVEVGSKSDGISRSPGQVGKHYSPRTEVRLVEGIDLVDDVLEISRAGLRVEVMSLHGPTAMPNESVAYAAELYGRLHDLDAIGLDLILIEMPPDTPEWAAVRDRLTRAAAP